MYGRVFNVQRFCLHDGRGIRTTVFLQGCPLSCWWCHNPESQPRGAQRVFRASRCIRCGECVAACPEEALCLGEDGPEVDPDRCSLAGACARVCPTGATELLGELVTVESVMAQLRRDVPYFDESEGGVTFSGGEPLLQGDFLLALLEACRAEGIHTTVDTCGHAPAEVMERVAGLADAFLYDVKLIDDAAHRRYTGVANRLILENLRLVAERRRGGQPELTIRVPLVAGINDDDRSAEALAAFLADLEPVAPVDLLPYQPLGQSKYERLGVEDPLPAGQSPSTLRLAAIVGTLRAVGLPVTLRGKDV